MIAATIDRPLVEAATEGMTTAQWQLIEPTFVTIDSLRATQDEVCIGCLLNTCKLRLRSIDELPHVVELDGRRYVEDGHHRLTVQRLRGYAWTQARVFKVAA